MQRFTIGLLISRQVQPSLYHASRVSQPRISTSSQQQTPLAILRYDASD